MSKDPAMLWYWNDWFSSTSLLSRFLKGCYMDVLHAQFNNGRLSLEEIKTCLGSDFGTAWPAIQKKFKQDETGLFFNARLEIEKEKRRAFSESRRSNLSKTSHMVTHMETHMESHMENENEDINTTPKVKSYKQISEQEFYLQVADFKDKYAKDLLRSFYDYWREKTPSGKMLFQLKPSWELNLRLATWKRNDEKHERKNVSVKTGSVLEGLSPVLKKIS